MNNRRRRYERLCGAVLTAFIGLSSFFSVFGSPGFETMRTLDVIRLMTAGAAVAVTIMLSVMFIQGEPQAADSTTGEKCSEKAG